MKVRRTHKNSYGYHQGRTATSDDMVTQNGKNLPRIRGYFSAERDKAFREHSKHIEGALETDGNEINRLKKTEAADFSIRRTSRNPFKGGINITVRPNKSRDESGRKMFLSTSSDNPVKAFKEYLNLKEHARQDIPENIPTKEIKDEIRRVARKKAYQKGAIIAGGSILLGSGALGAKKLADKKKKQKGDEDTNN